MKKKWIMIMGVVALILVGGILIGPIMSNVETPSYQIINTEENIEIRLYNPMIIAEVEVPGKRRDAISEGFRLLADYIFGNNTMQESMAMTVPVQQQVNKKIAMTAPVQQESTGTSWKISFVMPSEYDMKSLPKPNDDRVTLKEVPPKKFVVIQFSGASSDKNVNDHKKKLLDYVIANGIKITDSPKYAFYNPPWTLPLMRRNEIMFEIKP